MYQLYYSPNNASLAPHFILHHLGVDYQLIRVNRKAAEQKSRQYLQLNPAGQIPTLVDDGVAIFESAAICIHLCESHHALIPKLGDATRPQFFQWLSYLTNTQQAELMIRFYPQRHTSDDSGVDAIIEAQQQRIVDILQLLDQQLVGKSYLLGDNLSACDYFLFMLAGWAMVAPKSPLSFNHLGPYLRRLATNPHIKAVCEIEAIDLTAYQSIC